MMSAGKNLRKLRKLSTIVMRCVTKATKDSDIFDYKLRVLRAFVVKNVFLFLVAASWLKAHTATRGTRCEMQVTIS